MRVAFQIFRSTLRTWDSLCLEAAAFATELGRDRLISISMSEGGAGDGVVTVWYWEGESPRDRSDGTYG